MIKPLKPLSLRNFSGTCIVWGYSAYRAGSSVRKCFLFQQYSSEKNGSCDLGTAQGAQGALPLGTRAGAQPKTRGLKITEENVLPPLCHLQVAKLSLIRTQNLRPPLTAFYSSPTMLERLRCTRYIKGHFIHFIVLPTKKGL